MAPLNSGTTSDLQSWWVTPLVRGTAAAAAAAAHTCTYTHTYIYIHALAYCFFVCVSLCNLILHDFLTWLFVYGSYQYTVMSARVPALSERQWLSKSWRGWVGQVLSMVESSPRSCSQVVWAYVAVSWHRKRCWFQVIQINNCLN